MAAARRALLSRILGARSASPSAAPLYQDHAVNQSAAILGTSKQQEDDGSFNFRKGLGFLGAAASSLMAAAGIAYADEAEHGLPPPSYPWPHNGFMDSYDHASLRRGLQVYQQVCAACHSLNLVAYRDLVGVTHTEEEVKALASEIEVMDGPNDEGEMYSRPGKPSDYFPSPYPNEQAARFANGGAYPPDLSLMAKARFSGHDYIFSLLTGYRDPPAGVTMREGLHYNPYFPGGAIAMPKILMDEGVEYEDGTPATTSQMAKDVTSFLAWAAEPETDERKLMGMKAIFMLTLVWLGSLYSKRWRFATLKARRLVVDVVN